MRRSREALGGEADLEATNTIPQAKIPCVSLYQGRWRKTSDESSWSNDVVQSSVGHPVVSRLHQPIGVWVKVAGRRVGPQVT